MTAKLLHFRRKNTGGGEEREQERDEILVSGGDAKKYKKIRYVRSKHNPML